YGEVWQADGPGQVAVALKFVPLRNEATEAAELRSLDLMRNIRHAHLLALFGVWRSAGHVILAMELADGTLLERFRTAAREGRPGSPRDEPFEYMDEAAKGIDHLNELGIQHRDIKPENLLLVGGSIKVADFGLAKLLQHSATSNTGVMTPAYAAPEFFNGET